MPINVNAKGTPASKSWGCASKAAYVEKISSKSGDCPDAYEDAYCAPTASVEIKVSTKSRMAIASDLRCLRPSRFSQYGLGGRSQASTSGVRVSAGVDSNSLRSAIRCLMRQPRQRVSMDLPKCQRRLLKPRRRVSSAPSILEQDLERYAGIFS